MSRRALPESAQPSAGVLGVLQRYASFAVYPETGNYSAAGRLVQRSRNLGAFRSLVQHLSGPSAFLVFALYWLSQFDCSKEAALVSLLAGNVAGGSAYDACFDFARGAIGARDLREFEAKCRDRLRQLLADQKRPLVLEIVGTNYRPCVEELCSRIESLQEEAFRRSVLDGQPQAGAVKRIREYVEGIEVLLVPEPYNGADRNAVSVLLRFPQNRVEQAGYLKREIAAILAPMIAEGVALSGRLYELRPGAADVQVMVGRRNRGE